MAGKEPTRPTEAVEFEAIHFGVGVEVAGERPTWAALGDERFDPALHVLIKREPTMPCAFRTMTRLGGVDRAEDQSPNRQPVWCPCRFQQPGLPMLAQPAVTFVDA